MKMTSVERIHAKEKKQRQSHPKYCFQFIHANHTDFFPTHLFRPVSQPNQRGSVFFMDALMRLVLAAILLLTPLELAAQSSLPPWLPSCPTDGSGSWNNCVATWTTDTTDGKSVAFGWYVNGRLNGRGMYEWPNGNLYVGDFFEGKFSGEGTISYNWGAYVGQFEKGERHGYGIEYRKDGTTLSGRWEKGQFVQRVKIDANVYPLQPVNTPTPSPFASYRVSFTTQDWPQNALVCHVYYSINGKPPTRVDGATLPGFWVDVHADTVDDHKIDWQGNPNRRGTRGCDDRGSIWLSELYAESWRLFEKEPARWFSQRYASSRRTSEELAEWSTNFVECVRFGMLTRRLPYRLARDSSFAGPYPGTQHPVAREVFGICSELLESLLEKSKLCTVQGRQSTCDESYVADRNGTTIELTLNDAISARLSGEKVRRVFFESNSAWEARKAEEATRAAQEKRDAAIARAESARREAWLKTPEGRKHLAEEQARRNAQQAAAARQAAEQRDRLVREYPYYAVLTCGLTSHISISACLSSTVNTEIELQNGQEYDLHTIHTIYSGRPGREQPEGYVINLRSSFVLKVQNASPNLILGVKIFKRATGEVTFQKKVSRFGVINVKI